MCIKHFRFHSNVKGNRKGFQIKYTTHEKFSECGGEFSNGSGFLVSPLYPNHYPILADCVYLISQPIGSFISIYPLQIDIDCEELGVLSDFIEIRDGKTKTSPLIGKFCGKDPQIPAKLTSSQNHMRIREVKMNIVKSSVKANNCIYF